MGAARTAIRCPSGHSFDLAREGYVNLTTGSPPRHGGDTAEMVDARAAFLAEGHMQPLAEALASSVDLAEAPRLLLEVGSGTGYHLDFLRNRLSGTLGARLCAIGLDASKAAVRRAARKCPSSLFGVADVEAGIPVRDATADLVLSVFAPRPVDGLKRVTRIGGMLVVAAAGEHHLERLRERFDLLSVRPGKLEELQHRLAPEFELVSTDTLEYALELSPDACRAAIMMGPNAWHRGTPPEPDAAITDLASLLIGRFRRLDPRGYGWERPKAPPSITTITNATSRPVITSYPSGIEQTS